MATPIEQQPQSTLGPMNKGTVIIMSRSTPADAEDPEYGPSFGDIVIRHAFIRKVYTILLLQLTFTTAITTIFLFVDPLRNWILINGWVYHLSYWVFIVIYFVMFCPCCNMIVRVWPWNYLILWIFTLSLALMTATVSSYYEESSVVFALIATAVVVFILTMFAMQTKYDFTKCGILVAIFSIIFTIFGIVCIIYYLAVGPSKILHMVFCAVGAVLFCMFIVYDTQLIIGGKNRRLQLNPEDYILGAVMLYLDIVNLFISLLGISGERRI